MSLSEPVNILLVDDRPEGLFTLETVLKSPDYNLVKAESGEQALKRMLDEDFALVLLDVQMPGMDGFETAALIRERKRSRHVPIIFVTAINKEEVFVNKGYEAGAVDYIFKPFNPEILKSKVSVFVDLFNKTQRIKEQELLLRKRQKQEQEEKLLQSKLENLRRYENLANSIPHMVWRAGNDGRMDYFNKVWLDYTAQDFDQACKGEWKKAIHSKDCKKLMETWNQSIIKNKDSFEIECRIQNGRTGVYEWFWTRAFAERDHSGHVISWIGSNTDIKEKKELEKQKASFLSIASHELKTPLTALKTSLEAANFLLEPEEIPKKDLQHVKDFLRIGVDSTDRMDELLEEFLDFSRVESARMSIKPKRSSFSEIVHKAVECHLPKIAQTGRLKLSHQIEDQVYGKIDAARLRQVVDNLLGNAIKYTPDKGKIDVKLVKAGDQAILSVKDEGIGMDEKDIEKIFKPFKRVSDEAGISGLGIGLYISSWIVEEHDGRIEVTSHKGKGSEFRIRLPAVE